MSTFFLFFFFFFSAFTRLRRTDFTVQRQFLLFIHCFVTVHHCISTVHILKNIKNESHDTIYTFKNYFITVFSVFSFQFSISTTINSIQTELSQFSPSVEMAPKSSLQIGIYGDAALPS